MFLVVSHDQIAMGGVATEHRFLPRDAMHKRGLCCRPVSCPSVRPSVCHVGGLYLWLKSSNFILGLIAQHSSFLTPSADMKFQDAPFLRYSTCNYPQWPWNPG